MDDIRELEIGQYVLIKSKVLFKFIESQMATVSTRDTKEEGFDVYPDEIVDLSSIKDEIESLINSDLCGEFVQDEDEKFIAGDKVTYKLVRILRMINEKL